MLISGDLATRSAIQELYGVEGRGKVGLAELTRVAEPWRPYRGRACRYLWAWKNVK